MARDKTTFKAQNIITGEILEGEISTIAELTGVQKQMIYKKALAETPYKEEWIFSKESIPVEKVESVRIFPTDLLREWDRVTRKLRKYAGSEIGT